MIALSKLRVHVLYDSSNGAQPHGCSMIRLLRPLAHPSIRESVTLSYSTKIPQHVVDVVIIERLWGHFYSTVELLDQLSLLRKRNIKIIYETDDDLLTAHGLVGDREWPTYHQKNILRLLAREADGIITSTFNLAKALSPLNENTHVFENALDESLFHRRANPAVRKKIKFGYMGTYTHLNDLIFASAAIKGVLHKFKNSVEFEIVGVGEEETISDIFGLACVTIKRVPEEDVPYEKFCAWMSENLNWDFGIAPLLQSTFSDSKSDIKFLDYSIIGIPGIYSNVPAYAKTVEHEVTGLLSDNKVESWSQSLERMITSQHLRATLANGAYDHVHANKVLQHKAIDLLKIIRAVTDK